MNLSRAEIGPKDQEQRSPFHSESTGNCQAKCKGWKRVIAKNMIHRDVKPANILFARMEMPLFGVFGVLTCSTLLKGTLTTLALEGHTSTTARRNYGRHAAPLRQLINTAWLAFFLKCSAGAAAFDGDTMSKSLVKHPFVSRIWRA